MAYSENYSKAVVAKQLFESTIIQIDNCSKAILLPCQFENKNQHFTSNRVRVRYLLKKAK